MSVRSAYLLIALALAAFWAGVALLLIEAA